jgi:hypothetical protein
MTTKTPKRLTDKVKPWITKAIVEHSLDQEEVTWDYGLATFPDPAVEDGASVSMVPALVLYLEIPTGDPETPSVYMNAIMAPFSITEKRVNLAVKNTLESLRSARDSHLESLLDKSSSV